MKFAAMQVSVADVFVKVLGVIFILELLVMAVLPIVVSPTFPGVLRAFVDAMMLTLLAAPLLWWVIIRPILSEHEIRRRAERQLAETEARLSLAADIQKGLLPKSTPALSGLDIAANLTSADATSGDFYDFIPLQDGSVGLVIADVSGHGIDSALLVASASAYLRALTRNSSDPSAILTCLNDFLLEQSQEGRFITMFFARISPTPMTLNFAAAGHRAFLMVDRETVTTLHADCPPLGVLPNVDFRLSDPIALYPGQTLLLVTDGIEESATPEGELFGCERLIDGILSYASLSAQETLSSLFDQVRRFTGGVPQLDDMTAVIVKVRDNVEKTSRSIPDHKAAQNVDGSVASNP